MKYTEFHEHRFRQQVANAMTNIRRVLDISRNPCLAEEFDEKHTYDDKYALIEGLTITALLAHVNVLEELGLTAEQMEQMIDWVNRDHKRVTLRFEAQNSCQFLQTRDVPVLKEGSEINIKEKETTTDPKEEDEGGKETGWFPFGVKEKETKKTIQHKVTSVVKEYDWRVDLNYTLVFFAGASPDEHSIVLQERTSSTTITIKGSDKAPPTQNVNREPIDMDWTWLLENFHMDEQKHSCCKFAIDRKEIKTCKTPVWNDPVQKTAKSFTETTEFASRIREFWCDVQRSVMGLHNPAEAEEKGTGKKFPNLRGICASQVFCPIVPLFERPVKGSGDVAGSGDKGKESQVAATNNVSLVLSKRDVDKFLGEQRRTMKEAIRDAAEAHCSQHKKDQGTKMISSFEVTLILLCRHLMDLVSQYKNSVGYIDRMLTNQLRAAIGKEVQPTDFDQFMSFHHKTKLFGPSYAPSPFCYTIRQPGRFPDGVLTMEGSVQDSGMGPVETFTRRIPASVAASTIHIPLNDSTTVQMTGERYLHGWMRHSFEVGSPFEGTYEYQLTARARQFSCFVVLIGNMAGPDQFNPKDAIVVQNKDEVLIPLLLDDLPSARDFGDAISSLSPEQQRFAKSFRGMQLESSVFGVCVVQLKPQLEDLLVLPRGSLTKEMRLTQDLLSLFVDYQIPTDLLSYDGDCDATTPTKIALVKQHTQSVLDVVNREKESHLQLEKEKADIAAAQRKHIGSAAEELKAQSMADALDWLRSNHVAVQAHDAGLGFDFSLAVPEPEPGRPFDGPGGPASTPRDGVVPESGRPFDGPGGPASTPRDGVVPQGPHPEPSKTLDSTPDFTKIPEVLDALFECHDKDNSLRTTTIKASDVWSRKRQETILSGFQTTPLFGDAIRTERNKAFDLLDALSRSGSLSLPYSELHVIVAVTHCFENNVMGTVVQDNINPIEKVEKSSLMIASTIHGTSPSALLKNEEHTARLRQSFPALYDAMDDGVTPEQETALLRDTRQD